MSVALGAQKLQAKVASMQQNYQAAIPTMSQNWVQGLTEAGAAPGPTRRANYERGIQTGAAIYGPAVAAGVAKWQNRFVQAMSR